jgi:hypothetical protein
VGVEGIVAHVPMRQTTPQITDNLAVIDEKVNDILRAQGCS